MSQGVLTEEITRQLFHVLQALEGRGEVTSISSIFQPGAPKGFGPPFFGRWSDWRTISGGWRSLCLGFWKWRRLGFTRGVIASRHTIMVQFFL